MASDEVVIRVGDIHITQVTIYFVTVLSFCFIVPTFGVYYAQPIGVFALVLVGLLDLIKRERTNRGKTA